MSRLLFASLIFATACTTTMSDDDPGGVVGDPDVTPRIGAWYYASTDQVSNTCSDQIDEAAGDFAIDSASAAGFHVLPNDGTSAFSCTLSSGSFVCADRLAKTQDFHPAVDAIVTVHATATGVFSAENRASGRQTATADCTGSACSSYGSWPCSAKVDFTIAAR